ncbi:PTS galactitol transporter subunit IIB [Streptococcus orisasini]|uniref:PTS galactitol transporter subunit IIB n=1 Tax=Streptococcus orisasini TaxID=1080071 RepID=UPI00070F29BB|nr:PTS galactitol transporter subunit IIB [Streptococcus orisasini]
MKKVIVACGGAVATSTVAANRIKELCDKNGIDLDLVQCRISEIESHLSGTDLICTTMRVKKNYDDIPVLTVMGFISGINEEKLEEDILGYLR